MSVEDVKREIPSIVHMELDTLLQTGSQEDMEDM